MARRFFVRFYYDTVDQKKLCRAAQSRGVGRRMRGSPLGA